MSLIKITASETDTINYINTLWYGSQLYNNDSRLYKIFRFFNNIYYNYRYPFRLPNIRNNLSELQKLGFLYYNGRQTNNEQPIENNNLENDFIMVEEYLNSNNNERINILQRTDIKGKKICYCTIFYKYKKGSTILDSYPTDNLDNFRFFINHHNTIKILDRIWYKNVLEKSINNMPDPTIFKVKLITSAEPSNLINIANINTLSMDNIVLLDLIKAYDSINWDVLRDLLYSSLLRKMNILFATELLEQYMCIITNRVITYMKKIIKVSKSIPTGLPSSMLVFTYIIEEIIIRWLSENINYFHINIDFILNIYIDDIYIKIINLSKTNIIIESLTKILNKYKLNISYDKSRISSNLNNNTFKILCNTDLYLGIPFTRDIPLYLSIIINEFYKKHNLPYTWFDIYNIIQSNDNQHKQLIINK